MENPAASSSHPDLAGLTPKSTVDEAVSDRRRAMTPAHIAAAGRVYTARRARDLVFGAHMDGFGEPGWDMLLTIVAAGEAAALDHQMLITASASPAEIARPYLSWLESHKLVVRVADQQDPQRALVALSDRGQTMMLAYLDTEIGVAT